MTVKELLAVLSTLPENRKIVMAQDAEGNGFSPLRQVDECAWYTPETTWYGKVHNPGDLADGDDVLSENSEQVLLLWPVN